MPIFGTFTIWIALAALVVSLACYLTACARRGAVDGGAGFARAGRAAFMLAALCVLAASATLGSLLVTHRFDVKYVYEHSARAMSPLYYFPSFWAGQEGSFLLWGFWISILGIVLTCTSGASERRVMPIYGSVLLFLVGLVTLRSPFLPTVDEFGLPATPSEGLGLNPNLENYWMVIHPPTLFLGFAALTVPFAFALSALFWKDWEGWLRRALPWGLFGFAILGLAMMMGGYWAYEMLGWGGFWEWDPVENGPFVPWIFLIGFLHAAQIQRVRGGFDRPTLLLALLPFCGALYETFLTRTGILDKFSVHSFSTLGGAANGVLLGALLLAVTVSVGALLWRNRTLPNSEATTDETQSREFGYTMAIVVLTLCATIAALGLSAPLLTGLGVKMHLADFQGSVREDYHNKALFPIAVLLAIGMGLGPHLAWRGKGGPNSTQLVESYAAAVLAAVGFIAMTVFVLHTSLTRWQLIPQLLLFTASVFAIISNIVLLRRLFPAKIYRKPERGPLAPNSGGTGQEQAPLKSGSPELGRGGFSFWTIGGTLSHLGAALMLVGIVCLVVFTRKDPDVLLVQNRPTQVLDGEYSMVYRGQSGNFQTDRDNALLYDVASRDGKEQFQARLPYAERPLEDGTKMIFGHPAIIHHAGGDLYFALKNEGPVDFYRTPVHQPTLKLGDVQQVGPYKVEFMRFDNPMGAVVRETGQIPDVFPVKAVLRVTYAGITTQVAPQFIRYRDNSEPKSPELKLPGGWLVGFVGMNAGSADQANPGAEAMSEAASLTLRQDSGPPAEGYYLEVTTRPMINFVWLGTLLLVVGGLISMRRRILENRLIPIPDLVPPAPDNGGTRKGRQTPPLSGAGGRIRSKPAPSLSVGKVGRK